MTVPVLPYVPSMGIQHALRREFIRNKLGDGFVYERTKETAISRADGNEGVDSYKGLNRFRIGYNRTLKGNGNLADLLWSFFITRLDNLNEPFYFYNPTEFDPPDETGVETIGRYYVRLVNPNQVLDREYFKRCLYSYALELEECRDFEYLEGGACEQDDGFTGTNGDPPDTSLWDVEITGSPPPTFELYNGTLKFSDYDNVTPGTGIATSKFVLDGSEDFDIQIDVDYQFIDYTINFTYKYCLLVVKNANRSIWAGVGMAAESYTHVAKGLCTIGSSTSYALGGALQDTKFRLVKSGGVLKAYHWVSGQWSWAGNPAGRTMSENFDGLDVYVEIYNYHTTEETQLAYDNFQINSGCPGGVCP